MLIGHIRGLTDGFITLYVCEMVIDEAYRGLGFGDKLLQYIHEQFLKTRVEMLAVSSSRTFYEQHGYRSFYGFRKTFD
ncbi:GNAT family N-acetyltransferase [Lentibacillus salinarum]|uniref:GNAT family N-acetyltransferase n=1 Tax=Lentibacillus salinarum TaxID=446820 RepID=A0ABW3ZVN5_9BACI